jgi:hypothetical protein
VKRLVIAIVVLFSLIIFSCTNIDSPRHKVNPEFIYFDFLAWGDEESGNITVKMQFRAGGPNQEAIVLKAPSQVSFDGKVLQADSNKLTGPYYEVITPASDFSGQHKIVFTDIHNKQYTTAFDFPVITIANNIDSVLARGDLVLELNGLKPNDRVRVILTDTTFYGRGIEKMDTMETNTITITSYELMNLKNGPVYLELFREEDIDLQETMQSGGRFYLTYGLKREFILKDL